MQSERQGRRGVLRHTEAILGSFLGSSEAEAKEMAGSGVERRGGDGGEEVEGGGGGE